MKKKVETFQLAVEFSRETYVKLILVARAGGLTVPELIAPEKQAFVERIEKLANLVDLNYTVNLPPQQLQVNPNPSTEDIPKITETTEVF